MELNTLAAVLKWAPFTLAATFFVLMATISHGFFAVEDKSARAGKRGISLLVTLGIPTTLWLMWDTEPLRWYLCMLASFFYIYALCMFLAAHHVNKAKPLDFAFSRRPPAHLVRQGPYGLVRHPFYSSYCAAWIGGFIAAPTWQTGLMAMSFPFIYLVAALREERLFLGSPLAESYRDYQNDVGMFVPFVAWRRKR